METEMPQDLWSALEREELHERFAAMSPPHRFEWLRAIGDAKRPETRAKRINECVDAVRARR